MRAVVTILLVIVVAIAAVVWSQSLKIRQLERVVEEAKAGPRVPLTASLDLQGKCADQARKVFLDMGYTKNDMAGYENHYSPELNRCFIKVVSMNTKTKSGTVWTFWNIYDAFEGTECGTYAWHTVKDKKYWEVPPFHCEVTLPSGEKQVCHSESEFTDLAKVYMGEPHGQPQRK